VTTLPATRPSVAASRPAVRPCPTCRAVAVEPVHRLRLRTPEGHPLQGGYDVVSCLRCGTGFADAVHDAGYYDRYYAELAKYATEASARPGGITAQAAEPAWVRARFEQTVDQLELLLADRSARVLDVGCANGSLLGVLAGRGYRDVRGVDPSPLSARAAAEAGLRVEVGTFAAMPAGLGTFDVVCATGVLEHLWDVEGAMATLVGLMTPGGAIYVEVPDASRYVDPYIAPFQDFGTEHVNHFSGPTLRRLGARFGLETLWEVPLDSELAPGATCAGRAVAWRSAGAAGSGDADAARDVHLVDALVEFTRRSRVDFERLEAVLEQQLAGEDRFAVWGFGELAMKLLALPPLASRRLAALVDANPSRHGIAIGSTRVGPPADLPEGVPVVVASYLSQRAIVDQIGALGLANRVIVPPR